MKQKLGKNVWALVAIALMMFASCKGQARNNDSSDHKDSLAAAIGSLIKVAHIIDSDDESYWAYGQADSLLRASAKADERRVAEYKAITHIFYGMSYTRAVMSGANAMNNMTKVSECINRKTPFGEPANSELNAINACITFYEVSNMETAKDMRAKYDEFSERYVHAAESEKDQALLNRYYALNNKKLFFMSFANLIYDLSNATMSDDAERSAIQSWADELDAFSSESIGDIKGMNDETYQKNLKTGEHIQAQMIGHLAELITKLK